MILNVEQISITLWLRSAMVMMEHKITISLETHGALSGEIQDTLELQQLMEMVFAVSLLEQSQSGQLPAE